MATTFRPRKYRVAMVALAATLAGCAPNAKDQRPAARPVAMGELVPELAIRTIEGDSVRIAAGEPVTLLHVWATWCGPCRQEFPEIEAIQREFGPRGLRIVAVSVDDGDDDLVRAFAREWGATFDIGRDPGGVIRQRYQSRGVPETYLISGDGRLLARQVGALPTGAAALRGAIEQALGNAPPAPPPREVRRASA